VKILALDLGTNIGVAHNFNGDLEATTHTLATDREITEWGKKRITRRCDPRMARLHKILSDFPTPDIVVFEDVEFSSYTKQTQLWASFRTTVWLAFGPKCQIECVPVTTLKKFATGHGGATKEQMAAALFRQQPELKDAGLDDNAIDAIWLFSWAAQNLSRMKL
jgi:Holliday junction resolvasome RuvABC endonuclease subunit